MKDFSKYTGRTMPGMGRAQKAADNGTHGVNIVKELIERPTFNASPKQGNKFFENIDKLDSDTPGLDTYIKQTQERSTNTDFLNGQVYEGTVNAAVKEGLVADSGSLVLVGADGLSQTKKIDTVTQSRAIQSKFTSDPELGLDRFPESDMDILLAQAADPNTGMGKTPMLICNKKPTSELELLLGEKGIKFQIIGEIDFNK